MLGLIFALILQTAHAADFRSAFLAFEMPDGFTCKKNVGTYICLDERGPKMKDEIIVVSFKRTGPQDTLEQYRAQMKQPRTIFDKNKMSILSQVLSSTDITANAIPWIEAKHLNSEIQDYYTAYWVTKVGGVGMLISYSAEKNKKSEWERESEKIRNSLAVDGSAAQAVANQLQAMHPDLDGPQGGALQPVNMGGNSSGKNGGGMHMFGPEATITLGGITMQKSHFLIGIAALVALILVGAALRR
jgi:hypothetical protein